MFYLSLNIHIILFTYTAVDEQWHNQRILDAGILLWVPKLYLNSWKTVKKKCHLFKSHRIKSSLQLYLNILRHLTLLNLWFSTTTKKQNSFDVLFQPVLTSYFELACSHFILCYWFQSFLNIFRIAIFNSRNI